MIIAMAARNVKHSMMVLNQKFGNTLDETIIDPFGTMFVRRC